MNTIELKYITRKIAELIKHPYKESDLTDEYYNYVQFEENLEEFINALSNQCQKLDIALMRNGTAIEKFLEFLQDIEMPILTFLNVNRQIRPVILYYLNGNWQGYLFENEKEASIRINIYEADFVTDFNGNVISFTPIPLPPMVSEENTERSAVLTPFQRLFRLLMQEKRDILYIYFYALVISVFSLTLPLGTQAIMELVAGGVIFNSIVLLIAFVILGVASMGTLQILQYSIVESLQRRVFVKAALEFGFRMPRVRNEAVLGFYVPELMNRFFDVLTLQKGLPKLLMDLTGAILQIIFGLLLLALYHPFFIFFGITLIAILALIFFFTSPAAIKSSVIESKYKYKVAHWLEELARTLIAFKMAGHTPLPMSKMENNINSYLHYRKKHFKVLITQFANIVGFETLVTGGLLIMGSTLVINRQITIGQFVASEIVIILLLNAVEKVILNMSTVYDVMTAVDKLGSVTDLPLERNTGVILLHKNVPNMQVRVRSLKYKYPNSQKYALQGMDFDIQAGERVCLVGTSSSGKNTLIQVLAGILESYEGSVLLNNISLRDIHLSSLRDVIGKNVSMQDIFEGTILENINMGKADISYEDVMWASESLGLAEYVNSLPQGFLTETVAAGKQFPNSVIIKIILARTVAKRPQLLILNDFLHDLPKEERLKIINFLLDRRNPWTLMSVSSDPTLIANCDRILMLDKGTVSAQGTYEELITNKQFQELLLSSPRIT